MLIKPAETGFLIVERKRANYPHGYWTFRRDAFPNSESESEFRHRHLHPFADRTRWPEPSIYWESATGKSYTERTDPPPPFGLLSKFLVARLSALDQTTKALFERSGHWLPVSTNADDHVLFMPIAELMVDEDRSTYRRGRMIQDIEQIHFLAGPPPTCVAFVFGLGTLLLESAGEPSPRSAIEAVADSGIGFVRVWDEAGRSTKPSNAEIFDTEQWE